MLRRKTPKIPKEIEDHILESRGTKEAPIPKKSLNPLEKQALIKQHAVHVAAAKKEIQKQMPTKKTPFEKIFKSEKKLLLQESVKPRRQMNIIWMLHLLKPKSSQRSTFPLKKSPRKDPTRMHL